jgi:hypothetical protein
MLVLSHGEAKEIALLVAGDADALTVGALALEKTPSAEARTLVKDRLLLASVTLLSHVAPLLTADPEAEEKAPLVRGVDVLSARLAALTDEDLFARPMSTAASASIVVPFKTAALAWLWPYGVLIGLTLLFLILVIRDVLRKRPDHAFHNGPFVFFIFILIPVQTLFAHTWLTLPYYINRAFGGTWVGDNFEFFSNLNPILIFILSPMVAALTASRKVYPMMIAGTFVMGLPTFLLALGPNPGLLMAYIVLASIGEAMWQPRFLQWVAEIAPEGKTGAYMGIAQFPWFLTKVVTGLYSGWFLQNYCPMVGPQNTEFMWLIYGFIACSSSVALVLARGWASKGTAKHK